MNTNLKLSFVIFKGKKMADEVFRPQRPASNDPQVDLPENPCELTLRDVENVK